MNFENNKTKKILLTGTTYVMGKRWRRKNIKSKYQCLVRDIFPDKTDSQLKTSDKLLRKRMIENFTTSELLLFLSVQVLPFFRFYIREQRFLRFYCQ